MKLLSISHVWQYVLCKKAQSKHSDKKHVNVEDGFSHGSAIITDA